MLVDVYEMKILACSVVNMIGNEATMFIPQYLARTKAATSSGVDAKVWNLWQQSPYIAPEQHGHLSFILESCWRKYESEVIVNVK